MISYVFPGQGAQYVGMGRELYEAHAMAKDLFEQANSILGFRITDLMFDGSDEDLRQTKVTQPAIFLHSVISALVAMENGMPIPDMVAGHSLGEFSALVIAKALRFEDALRLVSIRAQAMQQACEMHPGTMAAVLRTDDAIVEQACADCTAGIVVAANYNSPGQIVISGSVEAIEATCQLLKDRGVKRAIVLNVGGAFHSPLMQPAAEQLKKVILSTPFSQPVCPIYQNVTTLAETNPEAIQKHLIEQLTSPVRWTQSVQHMIADGANSFTEFGPGEVLCGLIKKIAPEVSTNKCE